MQRAFALALVFSAGTSAVWAEDYHGQGLRPFASIGFTWGGQTILPVTITPKNSTTTHYQEDISAGSGLALQLGLSYRLGSLPLALQTSYGYHNDQADGLDGQASFRRRPIELLAQYLATDQFSIGFGVRRSMDARFNAKGGTCTDSSSGQTAPCPTLSERLKSSTGLVIEAEWMATPNWSLKARWVHEYFHFDDDTYADSQKKLKGDHVGLLTSYYFN